MHLEQVYKQWKKIIVLLEYLSQYIIIVAILCYLERKDDESVEI